ncbi:Uncharacterised protein g2597 [Pycnogonum litorale]
MIKGVKRALKLIIGEHRLSPFEFYTCLLEVANLVNQRPIGKASNDPDDGGPNDILLGRCSTHIPQGPFRKTENPRHRVEFVQKIINSFWMKWTRDMLPSLTIRKKWNTMCSNVKVNDIVYMVKPDAVRGNWILGRVTEVYPGTDGHVRSIKVKTRSGEYKRPITKICVLQPVD